MAEKECKEGICKVCEIYEILEQFEEAELNLQKIADYLGAKLVGKERWWHVLLDRKVLFTVYDTEKHGMVISVREGSTKRRRGFGCGIGNVKKVAFRTIRWKTSGEIEKSVIFRSEGNVYLVIQDNNRVVMANL